MASHPSIQSFAEWLASEHRADGSLEGIRTLHGADAGGADLAVCLCVANNSFYDARVKLEEKQLQVGFGTEHRMVNEGAEEMILENGGDLDDLLADELCDLGEEPMHMDHFFERPVFRFTVRLPLESPEELDDPALRRRVLVIIKACRILFQDSVDGA